MFQLAWLLAPIQYPAGLRADFAQIVLVCVLQAACVTHASVVVAALMYAIAGKNVLLRLFPLLLLFVATQAYWYIHITCIVIETYVYLTELN
jgi:hypothetical protein